MLTTIITTIAIAAICYAIYLKQELFNTKAESDVLTNDNRLKALSIERHLKHKIEMQQEYNSHLMNLRKRVSELELEVSKSNREFKVLENNYEDLDKVNEDLRVILNRRDETIARYVAEIEKLKPKETDKYVAFPEGYVMKKGTRVVCLTEINNVKKGTKGTVSENSSHSYIDWDNGQYRCPDKTAIELNSGMPLFSYCVAPLNPKDHPNYKAPKKPYVFDESKAPKSKSKQQIVAAKKLRNEKGQFAK